MNEIRFIDLFGGIGGISLGLERADSRFKCVGYYDFDKHAVACYNKNFGTNYLPTDITKVRAEDIPDHDLLCGGVPCQSWSIAGQRKGFEDIRGTMWFEAFKILEAKKPSYALFENVKGLLSHDEGKSFERLCEMICELGYAIDFTVLNSKFFGVPQSRERVFILCIRQDLLDPDKVI